MNKDAALEKITAWAKRRGFVYPSSEIYGGMANTYDFGPYGTILKNNVRDLWWDYFVKANDNIFAIDTSIILNPDVWHASGHVERFADAMIDCKNCKYRTRADKLIEEADNDTKVEGKKLEELDKII
ncbi:glycine--tRNA ligase, partial [Candidatus Dojkabacteria bacterium]|nr:glycine--tRNA ligase [Candidatus Dojkabacteria bacterium]